MAHCHGDRASRPAFELADILRDHGQALSARQSLSPEQGKVLRALVACRTAALGGHLDRCLDCGHERPAYNSCRNRHCPKCQALAQARWLEGRMRTLLPIPYFHVVFTLPGELAPLGLRNRRRLYGLLFRAASETLLSLGKDPKRLGAQLGITMVLHTWTRDLRFHPHVHAIVSAGGLALDEQSWVQGNPRFLFPVAVLSKLFRGKMLDALCKEHEREAFLLPGELEDPRRFAQLIDRLYDMSWITYAKAPFAGPRQILAYLGRYTHRVALSNHRLLDVGPEHVTLRTRGEHSVTLPPVELLQRFLFHILPNGFVRIRHYGLHASGNLKTKLQIARQLLGVPEPIEEPDAEPLPQGEALTHDGTPESQNDWRTLLETLTGIDTTTCPACGGPRWVRCPLPSSGSAARAPPTGPTTT